MGMEHTFASLKAGNLKIRCRELIFTSESFSSLVEVRGKDLGGLVVPEVLLHFPSPKAASQWALLNGHITKLGGEGLVGEDLAEDWGLPNFFDLHWCHTVQHASSGFLSICC